MIFTWVLSLATTLINSVVAPLPDAQPLGVGTDGRVSEFLSSLDAVVPISGPLHLVASLLLALPLLLAFRFAIWLYRLLPGKLT